MPDASERSVKDVMPGLNHSEVALAEKLMHFVMETTKKTAKRIAASE